jgi:hypothetical protein
MNDSSIDRPGTTPYTPDVPTPDAAGAAGALDPVDAIADALMRRLRPVLGGMPEAELLGLVRAIAHRRHRWDLEARTRGP